MTGRYYGGDATEFFYPPKAKIDIPGITQGILQPMPRLQELVLTIIEQTGTFPTAVDWVDIRQALAEDEKDLKVAREICSLNTFPEALRKLGDLKNQYDYNDEYTFQWGVPWSEHIKSVTEIKSALDSTKGLTKHMLTTPFI
ncbi:hypothetical protein LCGC14_0973930 [marine sediment metagenome]|uniref:Uncharacterized protein n=1 Tax=marine sediment metagenome TaxID=412755 RepID=A0A0F9NF95_9ZZZZ